MAPIVKSKDPLKKMETNIAALKRGHIFVIFWSCKLSLLLTSPSICNVRAALRGKTNKPTPRSEAARLRRSILDICDVWFSDFEIQNA